MILSDHRDLQSKIIAPDYYLKKNITTIKEKYYLLNIEQNLNDGKLIKIIKP